MAITVTMNWRPTRGHVYVLPSARVVAAARRATASGLEIVYGRRLSRRAQPRECKFTAQTVAVMAAMHHRDDRWPRVARGSRPERRALTVYEMPVAFAACRDSVDEDFVHRFLSTWTNDVPRDDAWRVWALFTMTDIGGNVRVVPVRR